jgi:hypothetical protein
MTKSNTPSELPSTNRLIRSTILAAVTSIVILVTVVMPAEYGIDPTGVGSLIGLKKMGEIKASLAKEEAEYKAKKSGANLETKQVETTKPEVSKKVEAKVEDTVAPTPKPTDSSPNTMNHETKFTIAPDQGAEIKLEMNKGKKVQYTWSTDGGKANFDTHADSEKLNIDYYPYIKGSEQSKEGEIEAAFDGFHGWSWRNRTSSPIVITLKTKGEYTDIKRLK